MSLFDVVAPAADTVEIQGGGQGFAESTGLAIGASTVGAVISGLGSIYNTFASGANALGADVPLLNTQEQLDDIDKNWGNYYKANANAIDVAGFIGSSLIPGTLGIKALNAARAGSGAGAVGRALGFTQTMQARSMSAALKEFAVEGGSVFTTINKNKLAAMGWGAADQVLQGAAFETAVALTMHKSPMLADDSWWDIGKTALVGAAFGGAIGGGIDALILNKSFKNAIGSLSGKERKYDYVENLGTKGEVFNLDTGDKAFAIVDSLLKLPLETLPQDKILDLAFHVGRPDKITGWNPLTKRVDVDVSDFLKKTRTGAEGRAMLQFEKTLRDLAPASDVASPFANKILGDFQNLRASGASSSEVRERMGDWLFELKGLKAATDPEVYHPGDLWYFKKQFTQADIDKMGNSLEDWKNAVTRSSPFDTNAYKDPYVFLGTAEQRQQAFKNAAFIGREGDNGYPTLTAAWKDGRDVALNLDGTLRVNDASKLWKRVDDPIYSSKRFVNTRTGTFTEDVVLTAADRAVAGEGLRINSNSVRIPIKDGAVKIIQMGDTVPVGADTEYFTARHAWASKLQDTEIPARIEATDFSLMDRLRTVGNKDELMRIQIVSDGKVLGTADQLSIDDVTRGAKLSEAQRMFMEAYEAGVTLDVRAMGYQLNVDAQWLENAVAVRFRENLAGTSTAGSKVVDMAEGVNLPLDIYTRRENLVADFNRPQQFKELDAISPNMSWKERRDLVIENVKNNGGQFVTGDLAWAYRVQGAVRVNKNAASAVLGSDKASQLLDLAQDAARLADSTGSGATSLGASNADYGDILRLWAQDTGKKVHLWGQQAVADMMNALGPISVKMRGDKAAAAEIGLVTNMLRGTDEKYVWKIANTNGSPMAGDNVMMLRELVGVKPENLEAKIAELTAEGRRATIQLNNPTAVEFLRTHTRLNAERIDKRTLLNNAKGMTSNMDGAVVYVPPVDTTYFQHFAFVRPKDRKAFGTSEVAMVFGRDAAELQKRMALVDTEIYDVISKKGTEEWFKAKDLYDFDKTINEPRINTELRKKGVLSNFYPEVRAETMAEDYIRWHQNQAGRLVRDAVETNYAQQFAEIRKLGESYTEVATSKFAGTTKRSNTEIINPFDDYLKTALDVSKRSEYTFLHQANEFVDALGVRAYQGLQAAFGDAKKGLLDYNEVNRIAESLGIKGVYNNAEEYFASNVPRDRNLIKLGINKANMLLANTVLRLDFFNSVLNTVSTPLMLSTELASIRTLASRDPELLGKLEQALSVSVPGMAGPGKAIRVPSTTKLIAQATANFFGDQGKILIARYKANGDIKDIASQFHSMIDDLAMRADYKVFSAGVEKAFETGAKFTGNNLAEEFTRFISADVMRQLTEDAVKAGTLSLKEQNAFISVFTNRVQGNYISSQRPIVFQGVIGSAISLFQTYSFNLMQQLLRHVSNKDKRAVATMFGMQAGLFGLNGTPFFEAVNTHIIGNAAINQGHYDAYSVAPGLLGKEMGDWLMYGTASAMPVIMGGKTPALYTRGDINPRHMTVLPLNPMDIPMIDSGKRVVANLLDMGSKLGGGADISETLLQGLEHNGINRPLAGLAQVFNGKATTSKGSIISASSDFDLITNSARILGSRPMDEAVALNNLYRMKAYQAADRDRTEQLGERVKSHLYNNKDIPDEDMERFMLDYTKAGGRAENFYGALQRWSKDANTSVVENMRAKLKSSYGQRLNEIMGGTPLPDYNNMEIPADPSIAGPTGE